MTCPSCGDSSTDAIRAIWHEYKAAVNDVESVAEAKTTLRSFFSEGDAWTESDKKIAHAVDALDGVTMTLIDLAAAHKSRHLAAVEDHNQKAMLQAQKTVPHRQPF